MIKNLASLLSRDVSVTAVNFLITIMLARYLSLSELAVWFSLQTTFLVLDSLFRFKSEIPFVVNYNIKDENISKSTQIVIILSCVALVIVPYMLLGDYLKLGISEIIEYEVGYELDIVVFSFVLSIPGTSFLYYLTAQKRYGRYNITLFMQSIINLSVTIIGLNYFTQKLYSPILGQCLSWLFVVSTIAFGFRLQRFEFSTKELVECLKSGISFYLNSMLATLQQQLGRFYCIFFLSGNELAFFGQIQALILLLSKLPAALNTLVLSEFSGGRLAKSVKPVVLNFILLQLLATMGFYLLSPILVSSLFGEAFLLIIPLLKFLVPFSAFYCISIVFVGFLNANRKFLSMNIILVGALILQVLFLLIAERTLLNLIYSIALFNVFYFIFSFGFSKKYLNLRLA